MIIIIVFIIIFFFVFIATEKIPTAAERLGRDFFFWDSRRITRTSARRKTAIFSGI